ncbi:MFS transporter [Pseudomonas sp. DR 5-09]|uniref:MFS transporter n=1 Tax=Pseudomonas sp. DR 5-09 TaxID=1534110 RepID=UPI0007DCFA95|nr:MFS transporter [Pseudomonas sp. DR 5-09]ANI56075.1 hypothetical protein PDR5_43450 [Pseudomonas sp. DR 5-09]
MAEAPFELIAEVKNSPRLPLGQLILAMGLILVGAGQTLLYALLGPAARQIGLSDVQTGSIVAISAFILTFASPIWGRVIDRSGSRLVYLIGMFSYAAGSLCFALVLNAGMNLAFSAISVLGLLIFVRVIYASMTAGIHPAAMASIAMVTPKEKRPAKMGLMSACFGLGSTLGPLLGAGLGGYGLLCPLYVVAALSFLNVLLGIFLLDRPNGNLSPEAVHKTNALNLFDSRVIGGLLATVLVYVGFSALQQSIAFHVQDTLHLNAAETVKQTGVVVFGLAVAMVITQFVIIQYFKPGPLKAISIGGALAFTGLASIALGAVTIEQITVGASLAGAGFAFLFPGLQGNLSSSVKESEQGSVAGLSFGAAALGYVIGPLIGTSLLAVGYGVTYWCAAILVLTGVLIAMVKVRS